MKTIHELAQELRDALAPGCEKIAIAGSIRRGKADPKDIELVAIPRLTDEMHELDLFGNRVGTIVCDHLHNTLQRLYANGTGAWTLDPDLPRNGPKYKRLRHIESGVCCDLFIVTAASWGVQLAIRTGPGDFSKELVTRARRKGWHVTGGRLHKHPVVLRTTASGNVVDKECEKGDACPLTAATPDEAAFFAALGLPYLEPTERTVKTLYALGMRHA